YGILVSKNDILYFKVIPRDGIYEIDMLNLVPNVNSIYNVSNKRAKHNLDSTYLWHYRLVHIRKERIGKLHHDGLLKSTNSESFDQCISCLSGKMTSKPFLQQTKRAIDLLGLIRTDVWGPLRHVSRQGYPKELIGYYFYFPFENKIIVSRYVEFLENNLISQEASGRAVKLKEIKDENTSPSENTNEHLVKVESFKSPQKNVAPSRRSVRTHRALKRLCLNVEVEEHSLGDLNEPNNYKAALLDPKSNKWLDAMNLEMQYMKENQVRRLVDLPPIAKTVTRHSNHGKSHSNVKRCKILSWKVFCHERSGETTFILGMKIYRDRSKRLFGLCQSAYMDKILKRFSMDNSKRDNITMQERLYLRCFYTRRSEVYAKCSLCLGCALDYKISKKSTTSKSTTKAEYIAALKAAMEAIWIRKFIYGLGIVPIINDPIKLYCKNFAALLIANEPGVQKGTRHYHRRLYQKES
nr:hypothetical protein [Tanacetum cinerariifolium]